MLFKFFIVILFLFQLTRIRVDGAENEAPPENADKPNENKDNKPPNSENPPQKEKPQINKQDDHSSKSRNSIEILKCKIERLKLIYQFHKDVKSINDTFKESWKKVKTDCKAKIKEQKQNCFQIQKNISFNLSKCKPYLKLASFYCKKEKYLSKHDNYQKYVDTYSKHILAKRQLKTKCLKYLK